ncbi:hypothetical protein F2Q69_00054368 [Brassica cretica]|uniref:Uncharacterized protein n=1 Tax=Brassica cretica TaxID=69181 RepID=A0A8S9N4H5_BRACR|nr:hypothetical protein F2Q69_00054368 [Brassica cretica]
MLPGAEAESRSVLGSGGEVHQTVTGLALFEGKQSVLRAHRAKADYSDQATGSSGSY